MLWGLLALAGAFLPNRPHRQFLYSTKHNLEVICPLSVPCLHHKDARRRTQYILYTNTMCHYPVSGIMIVYAYCHNLGEDKYVHRSCLAQLKKTVWYKHTHFTLVWKWLGTWIQLQHNSTNEWQEMWHPDKSLAGGETLRMGSVLAIWTQDTTEQLLSMVLEWNVIHRIVQLGFRGLTSGDTADWSLSFLCNFAHYILSAEQ